MIKYSAVWNTWMRVMALTDVDRKILVERLHGEVTGGFELISKIGWEEITAKVDKGTGLKIKEDIEQLLAFSVWSGYTLHAIVAGEIMNKDAFSARKSIKLSRILSEEWVRAYEKDRAQSLLVQIDPIVALFLQQAKQMRVNELLAGYPDLALLPYSQIATIDTFVNWAGFQGYILGILEDTYGG